MGGQGAAITGVGANTSLGGAVTACAAARARLARPALLERVLFDEEEGPAPVVGHPVPTVAGFQGEARLVSLALPALRELVLSAGLHGDAEVALCLALPDLEARAVAAGLPAPPRSRLVDRLVDLASLRVPLELRITFAKGPAGFGLAVGAALQIVAQRRAQACVVGGVDTLCDDASIDALEALDRLKTGENPVGLQPGEAAAFLLVESAEAARRRKARALAQLTGFAVAEEPPSKDGPAVGRGLTEALLQLAAATGGLPPGESWFVLDRNGEVTRANDWGFCQQRIMGRMPGLLPAVEWDPATSFGDTGAAGGALAVQLAAHGFQRRHAPGSCAVVLASSDGGGRAAIRVDEVS